MDGESQGEMRCKRAEVPCVQFAVSSVPGPHLMQNQREHGTFGVWIAIRISAAAGDRGLCDGFMRGVCQS